MAAAKLAEVARRFYAARWMLGTSGNLSAVTSRTPLQLVVTPSGAHKGTLTGDDFLVVDDGGVPTKPTARRPSAETLLHLTIVGARAAGAVLHTHSVWGTILSESHAQSRGLSLSGFEMLKGLSGVGSHEHREWVPVLENDQDMPRLASAVRAMLDDHPEAHAFLLRGHGLYTWGASIEDAERHVEILEFLFEVIGRRTSHGDCHHP